MERSHGIFAADGHTRCLSTPLRVTPTAPSVTLCRARFAKAAKTILKAAVDAAAWCATGQLQELLWQGGLDRVCIPATSLNGCHTPARGQSHMTHAPVPSRAAPGAAARSGCARSTERHPTPAFKIVSDHAEPMIA